MERSGAIAILQVESVGLFMTTYNSLAKFADDTATVVPVVDHTTTGQYGDGIGSENEDRQIKLILEELRNLDDRYQDVEREVAVPGQSGKCDLLLPDGTPVECKLLRYWRANGDPEDYMYTHVFSPFNRNTLMDDIKTLHESNFEKASGFLGLFYERADEDAEEVSAFPERFTAENLAEKVVHDAEYWYGYQLRVCNIAEFSGLQHAVHKQGAVITWMGDGNA